MEEISASDYVRKYNIREALKAALAEGYKIYWCRYIGDNLEWIELTLEEAMARGGTDRRILLCKD